MGGEGGGVFWGGRGGVPGGLQVDFEGHEHGDEGVDNVDAREQDRGQCGSNLRRAKQPE